MLVLSKSMITSFCVNEIQNILYLVVLGASATGVIQEAEVYPLA